ncbi:hypothetical protein C8F04DRAFT_1323533 [Mycena alexandri]|uniref:Uncharacterized protein n=1 Tax=Mycena alexandri TaxID=1745969 RepID=A0AAD6TJJ3_9AGAR|nr:hypothetical protein C8F04DRAFT_1323533 [Mycena alexandri]
MTRALENPRLETEKVRRSPLARPQKTKGAKKALGTQGSPSTKGAKLEAKSPTLVSYLLTPRPSSLPSRNLQAGHEPTARVRSGANDGGMTRFSSATRILLLGRLHGRLIGGSPPPPPPPPAHRASSSSARTNSTAHSRAIKPEGKSRNAFAHPRLHVTQHRSARPSAPRHFCIDIDTMNQIRIIMWTDIGQFDNTTSLRKGKGSAAT